MSLYNLVNGYNPACILILPMLGREPGDYPRFRDCFVTEERNIAVYTRVGGNNRNCGFGEEKLYNDPNFITTYDDEFDSTFATYEFSVPERWQADFDLIIDGCFEDISREYVQVVKEFYPNLAEKGVFEKVFGKRSEAV